MRKTLGVILAVLFVLSFACIASAGDVAKKVSDAWMADSHVGLFTEYIGAGVVVEAYDYDHGSAKAFVIDSYGNLIGIPWTDGRTYYLFELDMSSGAIYACPYTSCGSSDFYRIM